MRLTQALREVMELFEKYAPPLTNRFIGEELGVTQRAAYHRTYRLRQMGLIASVLNWATVETEEGGCFPWHDENGNYRSWLDLYPGNGEPDQIHSIFDNRKETDDCNSIPNPD